MNIEHYLKVFSLEQKYHIFVHIISLISPFVESAHLVVTLSTICAGTHSGQNSLGIRNTLAYVFYEVSSCFSPFLDFVLGGTIIRSNMNDDTGQDVNTGYQVQLLSDELWEVRSSIMATSMLERPRCEYRLSSSDSEFHQTYKSPTEGYRMTNCGCLKISLAIEVDDNNISNQTTWLSSSVKVFSFEQKCHIFVRIISLLFSPDCQLCVDESWEVRSSFRAISMLERPRCGYRLSSSDSGFHQT